MADYIFPRLDLQLLNLLHNFHLTLKYKIKSWAHTFVSLISETKQKKNKNKATQWDILILYLIKILSSYV